MKKLTTLLLVLAFNYAIAQQTTITLQPNAANGKDALLHGLSSETNTNYGQQPQLPAVSGTVNGNFAVYRSLLQFDLSSIPPNATINNASLSLYAWDQTGGIGLGNHHTYSGPNNFLIERVTADWDELYVTWNNQPSSTNVNSVSMPASTSPTQNYLNTNVTQLVKDMISQNNFGFMLRLDNEEPYRAINFCSSDHTNPNLRPKLTISYTVGSCKATINPNIVYTTKGNNAILTATSNTPGLNYIWQTNPSNNGWQNVMPNSFYAGTTSNTLTIFNTQLSNHLQAFRVITSKVGCTDTSNIGTIGITDTCTITKYVYDTVVIRKVDTSYITVTDTLLIKVKVGVSNSESVINTVKVYPNPTSSYITIDYGKFMAMSGYTLRISNSAGKVVYTSPINQQQSVHNLAAWGANGLYFIQIIDLANTVIDTKKIVLH